MQQRQRSAPDGTNPDAADAIPAEICAQLLAGLAHAPFGIVALCDEGKVVFASGQFRAAAGAAPAADAAIEGQPFAACFPALNPPGAAPLAGGGDAAPAPGVTWTPNRGGGWLGVMAPAPAPGAEGQAAAQTDDLTGLGNRNHLKACYHRLAAGCEDPDRGVIALFLDLDHFKRINDTLSHAIGDGLLCKVADRLKQIVRVQDVVARIGGDEFAILLSGLSRSAAEDVAARLVKLISRPFLIDGHQLTIGVSVGMACARPEDDGVEPLLQRADIALYESKRAGRGQFHWFRDDMFTALTERRDIETDLRKALLLDQFEVVYQPQLVFRNDRISGFEALIRWNHPTRGRISPLDFIGIAEESGLIVDIGAWVLTEACRTATTWPEDMSVAVNVSSVQFEDDAFADTVGHALEDSGLAPERLELELTETSLLRNEALVTERMNQLRALGIRISLDDFGIGYSSLNYLRKYPFDKVKIDQSFVREPMADEQAHQIVGAVAQLGAAFGMHVLAEGVETCEQLSRIRQKGCTSAQGYLFSPPIPKTAVAAFLAAAPQVTGIISPLESKEIKDAAE